MSQKHNILLGEQQREVLPDQFQTLNQALLAVLECYGERTCLQVKRGERYQNISYRRFRTLTLRLTNFFHQQGLTNGQRVAILADNPLEWMVAYIASYLAGAVAVPLRTWIPTATLHTIINDAGVSLAVVQGQAQAPIIEAAGKALPTLQTIVVVDEDNSQISPEVIPLAAILEEKIEATAVETIRRHASNISADTLALLCYKTSSPRGVMFDQARRLAAMRSMAGWLTLDEKEVALTTLLPWSLHTMDAALYYFLSGIAHVIIEGSDKLGEALQQTTPTIGLTTPNGFENFYNQITRDLEKLPPSRQAVFQWAFNIGQKYREAGLSASKELREAYLRADLTVFNQLRSKYGSTTLRRIYSTGAALRPELTEFFEIVSGFQPLNVYSLTEAGGFPAISEPDAHRAGSCGQVAPDFQIRIAEDGEVLLRGPAVMCGYWHHPEESAEVLDAEGWLHTGDLGRFDQDGFLYLTGHKQSPMTLSTGRRVRPGVLRKQLNDSPFIKQAVIFGEGRPYLTALIVPDVDAAQAHLQETGQTNGTNRLNSNDLRLKTLIEEAIEQVNNRFDSWRQIKDYRLLSEPLSEARGELTSAHKICYDTVREHYADLIEAMYPTKLRFNKETVTEVKLEPEQLRELLEKQDILDAWLADAGIEFLFELARQKQIDAPSMVHISETAAAIAQMQNEEKPLSTVLLVGEPVHIARHLPESEIQLQRYDHIRRMRQIVVSLAKMVDGIVLGYVVDKHGYLRGIHKLGEPPHEPSANYMLGPQFRQHAALSLWCEALVFFVPSGGRQVRVFADGELVGRYANGSWSAESIPKIDEAIASIAEGRGVALKLLRRILRCAFLMSEENQGAIFILGDADLVLEHSDPPEISSFATIASTDINRLTDKEIINFAKQDGATLIDEQGRFRGCMVLLRPNADTEAEVGHGKGARHSSAAKMSAEADCLAITVSQDGPITIYDSGLRVLSL